MNLSILALILIPLIAIPASVYVSKRQKWTDLAVSLAVGLLGMILAYAASFVFVISKDFWEVWAYGGVTSFLAGWLTLYSHKNI